MFELLKHVFLNYEYISIEKHSGLEYFSWTTENKRHFFLFNFIRYSLDKRVDHLLRIHQQLIQKVIKKAAKQVRKCDSRFTPLQQID